MPEEIKKLHISYTGLSTYKACPRMYYWRYKRKLEKIKVGLEKEFGKVMHMAIHWMFQKKKNIDAIVSESKNLLIETHKEIRKRCVGMVSIDDEQDMEFQKVAGEGLVRSYAHRYGAFLKKVKQKQNEIPFEYDLESAVFVGKIDNILEIDGKWWLHELKTTKNITQNYVTSVKIDFQTSSYFYHWNKLRKELPFTGIIFDIVRRPSIRVRQKETIGEFMVRLGDWYDNPESNAFYQEKFTQPLLPQNEVENTIDKVTFLISVSDVNKEDFYMDTKSCLMYGQCEFFDLCFNGEKENLHQYIPRRKEEDNVVVDNT